MLNEFLFSCLFASSVAFLSPAHAMENDENDTTSHSTPMKRSSLETVTLNAGLLTLSGIQLECCIDIEELETNIGIFSVSSEKLPDCTSHEIGVAYPFSYFRSIESDEEFRFEFSILTPDDVFMKPYAYVVTLKRLKD